MKNEYIPYEQALELKELGFDEPCLAHLIGFGDGTKENGRYKINQQQVFYPGGYESSDDKAEELGLCPFGICGVPLYQQAFRWFREKYVLDSIVQPTYSTKYQYRVFKVEAKSKVQVYGDYMGKEFNTYEEAELACLKKLIEIVRA